MQKRVINILFFLLVITGVSVKAQQVLYTDTAAVLANRLKISDTTIMLVSRPLNSTFLDSIASIRTFVNSKYTGGNVVGSGIAGQMPFWNSVGTQSSSGMFWDNANKRLGINTTAPTDLFQVYNSTGVLRHGLSEGGIPYWVLRSSTAEAGSISFSTPGGNPGLMSFRPGNTNRFDFLVNEPNYISCMYSNDFTTPAYVIFKAGQRFGINTTADNGVDQLQVTGSVIASSIKKSGGTPSQILAADGSVLTAGANISIAGGTISAVGTGGGGNIGTGSNGQVSFWNGTSSQTGNSNLFWDNTSQSLGIGTTNPGTYKLAVEGTIGARKLKVTQTIWADEVFKPAYKLKPLQEVEQFILKYKHLPDIPSEKQVVGKDIDVGDTQALLLKKIEDLTLYIIEMKKEINLLKAKK